MGWEFIRKVVLELGERRRRDGILGVVLGVGGFGCK